jgi:hypothetical protein
MKVKYNVRLISIIQGGAKVMPWFKLLVADLPSRRYRLNRRLVHVGFVAGKVAQGHVLQKTSVFSCQCDSTFNYACCLGRSL